MAFPRLQNPLRSITGAADATDLVRGLHVGGIPGRLPGVVKTPVAASSDAGFVANTGQGHGFHLPVSIADGVASGASLLKEGADIGGKYLPKVANAAEAMGANPLLRGAVKASPYLWAANMGTQAVDVAMNPEANKNEMRDVANYNGTSLLGVPISPEVQRSWYGLNNPVKAIAGTAQLTGDLIGTTMQNYQDARKQEQHDSFMNGDPSKAGGVGIGRALTTAFSPLEGGVYGSRTLNTSNDPYARAAIDFLSRVSPEKIQETLKTGGPRSTSMQLLDQSGQTPEQMINQINRVADRSTPTANPSQLSTIPPSTRDYSQARQTMR